MEIQSRNVPNEHRKTCYACLAALQRMSRGIVSMHKQSVRRSRRQWAFPPSANDRRLCEYCAEDCSCIEGDLAAGHLHAGLAQG